MAKRGIDISAHQGNIDLGALKNQIDFVIIRVGYGVSGSIDSKFKRNADLCEQLGLPYGFYWYSYALNVSGAQTEADHFLNTIAPYNPTMGCWFDMEDADGYKKRNGMPSDSTLKDMCYAFCEKVENAGYYSGIYASLSWFRNQLAGDRLSRFDKWVAMWPTSGGKQRGLNISPDEQTDWSMWQFTSDGKFNGYSGRLDTNYAYHDFPNPKDGGQPTPPTPEPTPDPAPSGSTLDLATAVMNGDYGDGDARKQALGDRYDEVQDFINHIFSASIDTLANEVINENKYGVGDQRKAILGSRYDEVQDRVNQILGGGSSQTIKKGDRVRFTGTRSYSGMKLASWAHNDVFDVIEISGDRVVIGKGNAVTSAVNIRDCQKV
jgi:GH25 family lysozyme M1 (1,4-beta-N-acetylmuramidase)